MLIRPIGSGSYSFSGREHIRMMAAIKNNFPTDTAKLPAQIIKQGNLVSKDKADRLIYSLIKTSSEYIEVTLSALKRQILGLKVFQNDVCIEDSTFTYNKKGEMIRKVSQYTSLANRKTSITTNLKREKDSLIVTKKFNDGTESQAEFSNDGNKIILKSKNPSNDLNEELIYIKEEKLESKVCDTDRVKLEAYADATTGEMLFSRDDTKLYEAFIELLPDGNYHKRLFSGMEVISDKIVPPSIGNYFLHKEKDLLTPLNDLITKISYFLS